MKALIQKLLNKYEDVRVIGDTLHILNVSENDYLDVRELFKGKRIDILFDSGAEVGSMFSNPSLLLAARHPSRQAFRQLCIAVIKETNKCSIGEQTMSNTIDIKIKNDLSKHVNDNCCWLNSRGRENAVIALMGEQDIDFNKVAVVRVDDNQSLKVLAKYGDFDHGRHPFATIRKTLGAIRCTNPGGDFFLAVPDEDGLYRYLFNRDTVLEIEALSELPAAGKLIFRLAPKVMSFFNDIDTSLYG